MSYDRFIRFKRKPPVGKLQKVLEDYIGTAGSVRRDPDRFYLILKGRPSFPFKRLNPTHDDTVHTERWIEVIHNAGTFSVLTRQADEYTNNVADGITRMIARYWSGRVDDEATR